MNSSSPLLPLGIATSNVLEFFFFFSSSSLMDLMTIVLLGLGLWVEVEYIFTSFLHVQQY